MAQRFSPAAAESACRWDYRPEPIPEIVGIDDQAEFTVELLTLGEFEDVWELAFDYTS